MKVNNNIKKTNKESIFEMKDATKILKRSYENPLLNIKDFPGCAQIYIPEHIMNGDEKGQVLFAALWAGAAKDKLI